MDVGISMDVCIYLTCLYIIFEPRYIPSAGYDVYLSILIIYKQLFYCISRKIGRRSNYFLRSRVSKDRQIAPSDYCIIVSPKGCCFCICIKHVSYSKGKMRIEEEEEEEGEDEEG